jgi:hypothetical protein
VLPAVASSHFGGTARRTGARSSQAAAEQGNRATLSRQASVDASGQATVVITGEAAVTLSQKAAVIVTLACQTDTLQSGYV